MRWVYRDPDWLNQMTTSSSNVYRLVSIGEIG